MRGSARAAGLVALLLGCTHMRAQTEQNEALRFRLHGRIVSAGDLPRAIAAYNQKAALPGLEPFLNPEMFDEKRVEAYRSAVQRLLGERLRGKTLDLNAALALNPGSPFPAQAIDGAKDFRAIDENDRFVTLQPAAEPDLEQARNNAEAARRATTRFDTNCRSIEGRLARIKGVSDEKGRLLRDKASEAWKRYAAALVWIQNAQVAAAADPAWRKNLKDAQRAAARYTQPSWIGLPDLE
jgi:hypothetical protein